ncbi:hypothetical protein J5N97_020040 [Dioscorea zingiberensis]|uniref:Transcriptional coactivator p15 (PC4) C-terminal domain-containing protein n=1 Tax=Dioscorea zingiberensis TaxID=325984 RepID=A0A9D5CEZ2_9LILI|nr:hypothetical protein J5N97_020040 [Dioscorea zingiberensis]
MWRRGKKRGDREAAGSRGAGSDTGPASKRMKDSTDDFDGIVVGELGNNRRVSVRSWQGKVVVDIREFYVKDGKTLPGKKGISLPMDQWKILREHVDEIDKLVKENS